MSEVGPGQGPSRGKPGRGKSGGKPPSRFGPRRPPSRSSGAGAQSSEPPRPHPGRIGLRPLDSGNFEILHPRCVEEREDDYQEGVEVWKAGEPEEAREILRFALEGCGDNLWIHVALGRLALEIDQDPTLARGHFGYAVELVKRALPPGFNGRLPRSRRANRPVYDALAGLADCFEAEKQPAQAVRLHSLAANWSGEDRGPS